MSRTPSSLPPFSFNWVGGNIHGLSNLAATLYAFAGASKQPISALDRTVHRLVSESGDSAWRGSAADGFKSKFGQDAVDLGWLASRAEAIGSVIDGLALNLAKIESWLENLAEKGVRAGYVTIDSGGKMGLPRGTSDPNVQKFLQEFNQSREQAKIAAKAARRSSAGKLEAEYNALSAGLRNYRDNHKDLLSSNEIAALTSSLEGLSASEAQAEKLMQLPDDGPHWGAAFKDAGIGAGVAGATVAGIAAVTGPLDPPIAAGAATVGYVGGFFVGLVSGK
jgi:hypothetical protein